MSQARVGTRRRMAVALVSVTAGLVLTGVGQGPAGADVSAVRGSAYGYWANFTIFGGGPFIFGPTPEVTLPAEGYSIPVQNSVPSGRVAQGPGVLFTSGPISVIAFGTTGPAGEVGMSSTIETVPTSTVGEILYAGSIHSSCEASEAGVSGSTTLAGPGDAGHAAPTLRISDGNPDIEGDETYVDLPTNPPPNHTINGNLESVGDTFRVVFNEQIQNPDGSLTVNAYHLYLLGPTAVGDLIVGQVVCGVTVVTPTTVTPTTLTPTTLTPTTLTPTTVTPTTLTPTTVTPTTVTPTTLTPTTSPPSNGCGGLTPTIVGTANNDNIFGTNGPDVILGGGGNDNILGRGGADLICGGAGNDRIIGGDGNNRIFGDAGDDQIIGQRGDDTISGGAGNDKMIGGRGRDSLDGGSGFDMCVGGRGTDTAGGCERSAGVP